MKYNTDRLRALVQASQTGLTKARGYVGSLYGGTIPNRRRIEVQQLGLATGQFVPVRRVKRTQIKVKYIPSK